MATSDPGERAIGDRSGSDPDCDAFAQETNVARWSELNWQFHSCLYEDAQRPYLVNTIRSVNDRLERYLRIQLTLSSGQDHANREHRELIEICRRRDAVRAAQFLHDHIMKACDSLKKHLPSGRVSTPKVA